MRVGITSCYGGKMDSFKLYQKVLDYENYIRKYVVINIPSVHRDIRIRFLDEVYQLIRKLYEAIYTKGNVRIKHITEMQVSISLLDFLTNKILDMNTVSKKHIEVSIDKLANIKNMVFAWKKNEENKKD